MKKLAFILFVFFHFGAQASSVDSLFQALKYRSSDIQLKALDSAYKSLRYADSASFVAFHLKAMQVDLDWQEKHQLLYKGRYHLGRWMIAHDGVAEGVMLLTALGNEISAERYPEIKAHVHISLSGVYHDMGSIDNALKHSLLALESMQFASDSSFFPTVFNSIGEDYRTLNNYEEAITYFDRGLSAAESQRDSFHIAMISSNKGLALTQLNRFDEAEETLNRGYDVAVNIGNAFGQAILLTNAGFSAKEKGDYRKALEYYQRSLDIKQTLGNKRSIAYTLNDIGETYYLLGQYTKSLTHSLRALRMIDVSDSPYYVRDINLTLARTYAANKQHDSAYFHLDASRELQEKILSEDNLKEVARIEQIHALREKDLENALLKAENRSSQATLQRGRWLLAFVILFSLAAVALGIMYYRNNRTRKKFNAKLEAQNRALKATNQQLNQLLNEQNSLFNIVTHDLKGPLMNSAQLLSLESEAETSAEKEKLKTMLHRSVHGALGFISEFNALRELEEKNELPKKELFDLAALIKEVLSHYEHELNARKIHVHFNENQRVEINSVPSYVRHILLNLLSNAVKFSPDKGSIFITISQSGSTRISIEDQGMGIKPENLERIFERFFRAPAGLVSAKSNGLGLSLVKLLVEKLNGKITVKSTVNQGSEFIVHIPESR